MLVPINKINSSITHTPSERASRPVKSSTGTVEDRWVIETEIELGQIRWRALVTLTDRNEMGLPMLLGRATLRGRFVVHPGRSFLLTRSLQRSALRTAS